MGTIIPARSSGDQTINYLRAPIDFSIGTAGIVTVGVIPAGCLVVRSYVVVQTVFNFGTNNLVKIGINGADTTYSGASVSVAALGTVAGTLAATANVAPTADTTVICTSLCTGTAGTTGKAFVVIEYLPIV
jgi:hypothetical protein